MEDVTKNEGRLVSGSPVQ